MRMMLEKMNSLVDEIDRFDVQLLEWKNDYQFEMNYFGDSLVKCLHQD
jgi:hypothetical protein